MMEGETSKTLYKLVEYNNTLYQIPVRTIEEEQVLLLSDVQSLIPKASAFLSDTKLVPFQLDPITYCELIPKRVSVSTDNTIWQVRVPQLDPTNDNWLQYNIQMQIKLDQLSEKLERLISSQPQQQQENEENNNNNNSVTSQQSNTEQDSIHENQVNENIEREQQQQEEEEEEEEESEEEEEEEEQKQQDPPPAFSSPSHEPSSSARHEAPPSYETSVLSTITAINGKLCLYESHISNRHKSPRWLSKRHEWLARVPNSIEEVAYQLVQLEMALLWTAVTESWIEERETWLTLVANARTERHLAGAMINLERHTLVMDENWGQKRERWINELLEMLVLPISHV